MSDSPSQPEPKRSRVVALKKPPPVVNGEAVALAEGLLQMAKSGELQELVVVWAAPDGVTSNERTGIEHIAPILGELRLVGDELSEAAREED